MSFFYISAAHKSSGKTLISIGLCDALTQRGLSVQPFKKGPDYIDPIWLGMAAGRACHNLDFHTMGRFEIVQAFQRYARAADVSLIEGNKGLHDGVALDGHDSNAALAKLLHAPVILVIDASGMTRGIAPLLVGYQAFDPEVHVAGIILNRVAGSRHEGKLRAAIDHYTGIPVLGAVGRDRSLEIVERHLGLVPGNELEQASQKIAHIGAVLTSQLDLDRLISLANAATLPSLSEVELPSQRPRSDVRIGIARDAAFGFYYPGDLEALTMAGAELVFINTLTDTQLPPVDGLFLGGGFPETQMQSLQANHQLRRAIYDAVNLGLPVYAECGGLMYLARSIAWSGQQCEMVGAIPADCVMCDRPQGRGYVQLRETGKGPWALHPPEGALGTFPAHEFHYARLVNYETFDYAYEVLRGQGIDGRYDGIVWKNTLAGFSHLRDVQQNHWAQRFVSFVRQHRHRLYGMVASV